MLASCEKETQHKHMEICNWLAVSVKVLVPDSSRLKMAEAVVDFDACVDLRFQLAKATYA